MSKNKIASNAITKPQLLQLEQRLMFDGAAVETTAELVADYAADTSEITDSSSDLLVLAVAYEPARPAVEQAQRQVKEFLESVSTEEMFEIFNGGKDAIDAEWLQSYESVRQAILNDDLSVSVELLDNETMGGKLGAFSAAGPDGNSVIYLNQSYLDNFGPEVAAKVLVEEIGHAMDSLINDGGDTAGDEGQLFADRVNGIDNDASGYAAETDDDHGELIIGGENIAVEWAQFSFVNAYEMLYDLDDSGATVGSDGETLAEKEQSTHNFNPYDSTGNTSTNGLGPVSVDDNNTNVKYFSGNDVSAIGIQIDNVDYYGWISRPIKSGGIVRGFYFWTDMGHVLSSGVDGGFNNLTSAQQDGNQDADGTAVDNRGFILVVDQDWFNGQITKTLDNTTYNNIDGRGLSAFAEVGSSSDRVDTALNNLIDALPANTAPVAYEDSSDLTLNAGVSGGPALEEGEDLNSPSLNTQVSSGVLTETIEAIGNVLAEAGESYNDADHTNGVDYDAEGDALFVTFIGSTAAGSSGAVNDGASTTIQGLYGSLEVNSDGSYTYTVDNANDDVQALLTTSDILTDTFQYKISDGEDESALTNLNIKIQGANDAPLANDDYDIAKEFLSADSAIGYDTDPNNDGTDSVLTNDTDVDTGDSKSIVGLVTNGEAVSSTIAVNTGSYQLTFSSAAGASLGNKVAAGDELYYDPTNVGGNVDYYALGYSSDDGLNVIQVTATTGAVLNASGSYDIGLSQTPNYYYDGTTWQPISNIGTIDQFFATHDVVSFENSSVLVENQSGGAVASLLSSQSAASTTLTSLSGISGTIAVGMTIAGPDVPAGTKVSAVGFTNGVVTNIVLDKAFTGTTGGTFTFVGTATGSGPYSIDGSFGTLTLNADGTYEYIPDTDTPLLSEGDSAVEMFTYTMEDTDGAQSTADLYITVLGSGNNDPIANDDSGAANEIGTDGNYLSTDPGYIIDDGTPQASGNVITNDDETSSNTASGTSYVSSVWIDGQSSTAVGSGVTDVIVTGQYGKLTISGTGAYSYEVFDANLTSESTDTVIDELADGETLIETFQYEVKNTLGTGFDIARLRITITGANDAVIATDDTVDATAGGDFVSGDVLSNDTDVDNGDTKTVIEATAGSFDNVSATNLPAYEDVSGGSATVQGEYGELVINTDGTYTYTLDNSDTRVINLPDGDTLQETFTYRVRDTLETISDALLTVTITGVNDAPVNSYPTSVSTEPNTSISFTASDLISVSDADGNLSKVVLHVDYGTLSTSGYSGSATTINDGTDTITITGTQAEINAALAELVYTPDTDFEGTDNLTIFSQDSLLAYDSDGLTILVTRDTDGDGISDLDDIDDDNDGIIDLNEMTAEVFAEYSSAIITSSGAGPYDSTVSGIAIGESTGSLTVTSSAGTTVNSVPVIQTIGDNTFSSYFDPSLTAGTEILDFLSNLNGSISEYVEFTLTLDQPVTSLTLHVLDSDYLSIEFTGSHTETLVTGGAIADLSNRILRDSNSGDAGGVAQSVYSSVLITSADGGPLTSISFRKIYEAGYTNANDGYALTFSGITDRDRDSDGVVDRLDIDSDNDGITDNIEAQSTAGYIRFDETVADADSDGLMDNYDEDDSNIDPVVSTGLTPVDTDSDGTADYLDSDSDDDGMDDITERHDGQESSVTSSTDTDGDGLLDIFESGSAADDYDSNDQNVNASGEFSLARATGVDLDGGNAVPLSADMLYRNVGVLSVNDITINEVSPYAVFRVGGDPYQEISLALLAGDTNPATGSGTDYGSAIQYSTDGGTTWSTYTSGFVALNVSGSMLVRTPVTDDDVFDNDETFKLKVSDTQSTPATAEGTATIKDDYTGNYFDGSDEGPDTLPGGTDLDDDRQIEVTGYGVINEASDWAMFEVDVEPDYEIELSFEDIDTSLGSPDIYYSTNGSTWTLYEGPITPTVGKLYVRIDITGEQDEPFEDSEALKLSAAYTSNPANSASDTTSIIDDGTGTIYDGEFTGPGGPGTDTVTTKDDDRLADLVTVKTLIEGGDDTPDEGDTVTFLISVTNNGAARATNVSLTDTLPAGLTYSSNQPSQGTYSADTGIWTIGTLNVGDSVTLELSGTVDSGTGGETITNITSAAGTPDQVDPTTENDDLEEEIIVNNDADLVTVKTLTSGDSTPDEGDTVVFQIAVTNNGAALAKNVSLTDSLPEGLTYVSSAVTAGSYNPETGLWAMDSLATGATATLTLTGTVDAGEGGNTLTNITTAATSDQNDPTDEGDDLEESVVVNNDADLVTEKTLASGDSTPDEGDTVVFQIAVTNNGAALAKNVLLTDSLPEGLTYISSAVTAGSYNPETGLWTMDSLATGATATLTLTGTVDAGEGGNRLTNITTAATSDQNDPTDEGDDLEESVVVNNDADLVTEKTLASGDSTPNEGDTVVFQIAVTNNGAALAKNVSLTDSLPDGLTYVSSAVTAGSYNAETGLWTIDSLATGASATLTLTGTVDAGEGGNTLTNITTAATSDQNDPTDEGDDLEESVVVNNDADLVTEKTLASGDSTPNEGDTVVFEIAVTNNGAALAKNVSLTDSLPEGLTYVSSAVTAGSYNAETGLWTMDSLATGASATLTLTGTVDAGEGGNTLTNITTAATSDQNDPTNEGDDLEESVVVNNDADLVTIKTLASGDSTPDEGDTVVFQIKVTNFGPAQASNTQLVDSLPEGITYQGFEVSRGEYNSVSGLWSIGTLDLGASATLLLTGTVDVGRGGETITNITTAATSDQNDPTGEGDDLTERLDDLEESVIVNNLADLVTEKTLLSDDANPDEGDSVVYQIKVTNNGVAQASNVSLIDSLPAGLTYVSDSASQGDYDPVTGEWSIGIINKGEFVTLSLTATVDAGEGGNTITNITTAASSDQTDPTTEGDDLDETVVINNEADLITRKTLISTDDTPDEGSDVVFQIQVTNDGAARATNVKLTDEMPAGLTLKSATADQGEYDADTGLWTIGTMERDAVVTLTLTATVDVGRGGQTITNLASPATSDQIDPTTEGDDLDETVVINNEADLITSKTLVSEDDTPDEGSEVVFQIQVTNGGAARATNVQLTDEMPEGLTLTTAVADQGEYDAETGLWTIGTMDRDAVVTLTLTASVDVGRGGQTITNLASSATSDQIDPTTEGDDLEETIVINNEADLITSKTLISDDDTPDEGSEVVFQIQVTNAGAARATNVQLTDEMPEGLTLTTAVADQGEYDAETGLWTIGTLDRDAVVTLTLTATVDVGRGGETITNLASPATSDQIDPTTEGDDLEETLVVNNEADLVTVKTLISGDSTPDEGEVVTFQIEVSNQGSAQAKNVRLTDQMPAGISLDGVAASQGDYDAATGLWEIGTLDRDAVATLTLTGTVNVGTGGDTITNIATAAVSDQIDPTSEGDDLEESVIVNNEADLVTVKTRVGDTSNPRVGDPVTFQIRVLNNGVAQASNVSLTDSLPEGLIYDSHSVTQGSYNPTTGLWSLGTLNNTADAVLLITATVAEGFEGEQIINRVTVASSDQNDPTNSGNDITESINVVMPPAPPVPVEAPPEPPAADEPVEEIVEPEPEPVEEPEIVAPAVELVVQRDIPVQEFTSDGFSSVSYTIPADTFGFTGDAAGAQITLSAVMADGEDLPDWLIFDPEKGEFRGVPPKGFDGVLTIRVIARDDNGKQVETMITIQVKAGLDSQTSIQGKPGVMDQFKAQSQFAWKAERDQLLEQARKLRA